MGNTFAFIRHLLQLDIVKFMVKVWEKRLNLYSDSNVVISRICRSPIFPAYAQSGQRDDISPS